MVTSGRMRQAGLLYNGRTPGNAVLRGWGNIFAAGRLHVSSIQFIRRIFDGVEGV